MAGEKHPGLLGDVEPSGIAIERLTNRARLSNFEFDPDAILVLPRVIPDFDFSFGELADLELAVSLRRTLALVLVRVRGRILVRIRVRVRIVVRVLAAAGIRIGVTTGVAVSI